MRDDSAEILSKSFLQEALVSSFGMGRDVHSFDVHPAFPLLAAASLTFQGAPKGGIGETVESSDVPETMQVSVS